MQYRSASLSRGSYVVRKDLKQAHIWHKSKLFLYQLDIELTERCNNNCVHCCINLPAGDLEAKNKELSTEEVKNILKEAVSLGCLSARFTGGEPLLREDFEELYIFARKLGLKVLLFTNATLINQRLADLFSRIPPLERIEVTLYGMKKQSYEAVTRVLGSFEAAWRGIRLLLEKKIPFMVKGALLPYNKGEIDEFEAWAAKIPWMDRPPSYSMFFDLRCRRDGMKNKLIKNLRVSPEAGLKILNRRKGKYIKEMKEFCAKFIRPPADKLFSCGSGKGGGCVDAYGNFQPCMLLRHPDYVYDLRKGSLKDALENFFPKLREIKATNSDYLNRCAKCFLKGLCEQCPAKSWAEHGTLDTPVEYLCEVAHAQAEFLGLIKENEKAWEVADWQERIDRFSGR
ncbi:MAG: radical SAM protein [Candidatus Omnitrophica bacterium]|jgi:radical SAM protein with 4Fe4S-binding SPASM domain|nr:radical SAM protein [Candidatus Omnitrophota bacterium]